MKKVVSFLSLILILAGALNWGLWGFFQFDLVAWICKGNTNGLSRFIYAIIGLAGVWGLRFLCKCRHLCSCKCGNQEGGKKNGGCGCG